MHFSQPVAADAYDRMIAKARAEVSQAEFLVIVCAGWNAENRSESAPLKEAFTAKQLSMCKTTRDLSQWACLNSAGSVSCPYLSTLNEVPKVLHQTNKSDHDKLKTVNSAFLPVDFRREFHDDARCEAYIKSMLGSAALKHYRNLVMSAHRADFFRYVLLFFEGGVYLDIKSCLLQNLRKILTHCGKCSLVTCIGASGSHIHQGILMCPAGHPLLHAAILKIMETPPASLGAKSGKYMTFCKQMWNILDYETESNITRGTNETRSWGEVFLMKETKQQKGVRLVQGQSIQIDGHIAYMDRDNAAVAIRCEGWQRGFHTTPVCDMRQIDALAQMSVSAALQEQDMGVVEFEQADAQPNTEVPVEQVLVASHQYYNGLTSEEIQDFILQGMVGTQDMWLACRIHRRKSRGKKFATWFCFGLD